MGIMGDAARIKVQSRAGGGGGSWGLRGTADHTSGKQVRKCRNVLSYQKCYGYWKVM